MEVAVGGRSFEIVGSGPVDDCAGSANTPTLVRYSVHSFPKVLHREIRKKEMLSSQTGNVSLRRRRLNSVLDGENHRGW